MKKILVIISLLVGVNGFTQTQDTTKVETYSFEQTLHDAYNNGYMMSDMWLFDITEIWGVDFNMVRWDISDEDFNNYTFHSIIYLYFENDIDGKRKLKSI